MFDWYDELYGAAGDGATQTAADAAIPSGGMADMSGFNTGATNDAAKYFGNNGSGAYDVPGLSSTDPSSMGDLFNTNTSIGSGLGDALGFGSQAPSGLGSGGGDDWLSKLGSQLGDKLFNKKDPLSSITGLVGALGALRSIAGKQHSDLPQVQALFDKGQQSPYKAANTIQVKPPVVGRSASQFVAPTGALSMMRKG
jgi:hypothetical protein